MRTTILIAVVSAVAIGCPNSPQPVDLTWVRVTMMLGCVLANALSARLVMLACCSATTWRKAAADQEPWWEELHLVIWLTLSLFLMGVVDWGSVVRTNWGGDRWILLDDLIIVGPIVLPWLVSWAFLFEDPQDWISSGQRRFASPTGWSAFMTPSRCRFVLNHARFVFGLGLLPLLLVCTVADVAENLVPGDLEGPQEIAIYALPLAALLVGYPWLLRTLWNMRPLAEGPLRERLVAFATQHRVRLHEVLFWDTHRQITNAAVTGIWSRFQSIFLTDALVEQLDDDDLLTVFAHELGHAYHGHVLRRILALLLPISVGVLVMAGSGMRVGDGGPIATGPLPQADWQLGVACGGLVLVLAYARWGLGWYSHQLEYQADTWACQRLNSEYGDGPAPARYAAVLRRMTADLPRGGKGWLHPGWESRHAHLRATCSRASFARVFARRLGLLNWGGLLLHGAAVICLFHAWLPHELFR